MTVRLPKRVRQKQLMKKLNGDPFLTDEDLAKMFGVSVQTVRLDRLELGLPELRERMKKVASQVYSKVRSVGSGEVIGDLIEVDLGKSGLSILDTGESMGFARTKIVRGHHIFAQANSLAVAIIDAPVALTGSVEMRFLRPVTVGERLVAKAEVVAAEGRRYVVEVHTKAGNDEVFRGRFVVFAQPESGDGPERADGEL
ncbi:MAG: transcription factor FapR [Bacillota bacterium]|nr:transcription factor FapR [Bacillota bacterium]